MKCQLCGTSNAKYDAKTRKGPWAYVCVACFLTSCTGKPTALTPDMEVPQ